MLLAFRKMEEITGLLPLSAGLIGCGKSCHSPAALQQDANKPGKKRITQQHFQDDKHCTDAFPGALPSPTWFSDKQKMDWCLCSIKGQQLSHRLLKTKGIFPSISHADQALGFYQHQRYDSRSLEDSKTFQCHVCTKLARKLLIPLLSIREVFICTTMLIWTVIFANNHQDNFKNQQTKNSLVRDDSCLKFPSLLGNAMRVQKSALF